MKISLNLVERLDQNRNGRSNGALTRREMLRRTALGSLAFVSGLAVLVPPESAKALTVQQAQIIVNAAMLVVGIRYVWGGSDPITGFDCSGLTKWAYAKAGIGLPRTAREQYAASRYCTLLNTPGTMLFFDTVSNPPKGVVSHVAIAAGDGSMVSANSEPIPGKVTRVWNWANSGYWWPRFLIAAAL